MKSKKMLMGYAALLILAFHFYIPFLGVKAETIFVKAAYVGVDLFFFLSGNSLGTRREFKTIPFYVNRLKSVYFPFAVLSVVCAVYKSWTPGRLLSVLTGWEFLQRNGGAFLWFFPALMMLYLFVPLFVKAKEKFGCNAFWLLLAVWLVLAVGLQYGFGYKKISILLMRVPIFLIGFFPELREKIRPGKWKLPVFLALWVFGWFLCVKYGAIVRLTKPLADIYYVLAIPRTLGILGLAEMLAGHTQLKPLAFVGRYTSELYGLQMVFGYDIESKLLKMTRLPLPSFLLTLAILLLLAICFQWLMKQTTTILFERKETKT